MKLGVTGTREGMTAKQYAEVEEILSGIFGEFTELHHGDCLGVDVQVATIAQKIGYRIVCHPPESNYLRAFHNSDELREPAGYLKRDRRIVDETDLLLVIPLTPVRKPKSGTWYTHDYAKRQVKPVILINP